MTVLSATTTLQFAPLDEERRGSACTWRNQQSRHRIRQWSLVELTNKMMTVCNANADMRYPGISGDFDQRVHLIQPATIFLPGYVAQTDIVCILVGQKFDLAPHREFVGSVNTKESISFKSASPSVNSHLVSSLNASLDIGDGSITQSEHTSKLLIWKASG